MSESLEERIGRFSAADLDLFKKQLPQRLKELGEVERNTALERLSGIPQLSDLFQGQPAPPMQGPEVPPAPEQVNVFQKALDVFTAPFDWVTQNVIQPVGGLFIPDDVPRQEGEDFWQYQRRQWKDWDAPDLWGWKDGVKELLEFLPWFAIPGVGQAGTITRGVGILGKAAQAAPWLVGAGKARGIAGGFAKLGSTTRIPAGLARALDVPGKLAATALQLSPWGITEQALGLAIGKAAGRLARGGEKVSAVIGQRVFGELPHTPVTPAMQKLSNYFRGAIAARARLTEQIKGARPKQIASGIEISAREGATTREVLGALKGQLAEPIRVKPRKFSASDIDEYHRIIDSSPVTSVDKMFAKIDLDNMLLGQQFDPTRVAGKGFVPVRKGIPADPEALVRLTRIFGKDFGESLGAIAKQSPSFRAQLLDVANLPRSVLASWDFSATLRQGLVLSVLHPTKVPRAMKEQFKAFFSEKLALERDAIIRTRPSFNRAVERGTFFSPMERGAELLTREESFMSSVAEKYIPGVRRSGRAFNAYLNEMRLSAFELGEAAMRSMEGFTDDSLRGLAEFINDATGRGKLPKSLVKYGPLFNALLFSPRYQLSTLRLPKYLLSQNPYVRKQAWKAFGTIVGGGSALLGLLQMGGVGTVELDPRSADFGKLKIGNTRVDIWRGYAQYSRFIAELITGEHKSSYGNMSEKERIKTVGRFLQSKTSPAAGLFVDLLAGEDYLGNEMFPDTSGALDQMRKRFLPLFVQDMWEAAEDSGLDGKVLGAAATGAIGFGIVTHINKREQARDI